MLRMYVAQQCFGLSDKGIEDAIYDSQAIRGFVGIDLNRESAPDATTLLKFRRLLETHELTRKIFETINGHLAAQGLMMREGTIVDATLIAAPPSTKNKDKKRDPEMHQSKKGNDWHFGLKAHIGVDAASGLVHTVIGTAGKRSWKVLFLRRGMSPFVLDSSMVDPAEFMTVLRRHRPERPTPQTPPAPRSTQTPRPPRPPPAMPQWQPARQ